MEKRPAPTVRDLYPSLSEVELKQAEQNLDQYLTIVLRIFERADLEAKAQGALTPSDGTLPCKRGPRALQ